MQTYFKDFTTRSTRIGVIPAWLQGSDYDSERSRLGHNTQRIKLADDKQRVYFSAGFLDPNHAIEAVGDKQQ